MVGTLTRLECTVLGVVGGIVCASDTIIDVLAVVGGVGTSGITDLEAEDATTHEIVPLDDLLVAIIVSVRPPIRVDKTAEGVSTEVSTVGIELSSAVVSLEVDQRLVDETDDLKVVGSPHELNTLKSASGDQTGTMPRLGAPSDFLSFRVTDGLGTRRRCPKAEV